MKQLLEITTTPIALEYKVSRAQLRASERYTPPKLNITRQKGGMEMRTTQGELRMDTLQTRRSAGLRTSAMVMEDAAAEGHKVALETSGRITEEGNRMAQININSDPFSEIAIQNTTAPTQTAIAFIPSVRPSINWIPANVQLNYTPDKMDYDWKTFQSSKYDYIPGEFKINVVQYPKVEIRYLGEPLYVPPSSNPNYEPVDIKV